MTLSSLGFIYMILPLTVFIFYLIPLSKRGGYLTLTSLVMLYGWEGSLTALLLSTAVDYLLVKKMWESQHNKKNLKTLLTISIVKNFGIAIIIAISSIINGTTPLIGMIVAPLSACYYHLLLSKGKIDTEESMITFFSYCLFFGKIFVGPIENPTRITPQLCCKNADIDLVGEGACLVIMGVAKKVLLYDHLTRTANELTAIPASSINFLSALLLIIVSSVRIYLFFSSFADIAQGIAALFSIRLTRNVYYPLQSRGVYEYIYRFNMTFAIFLEELFGVQSWDKEIGSGGKRMVITAILSLFISVWFYPSMDSLIWVLMITLLVGIQLLIPIKAYLYVPSFIVRIITALITAPTIIILSGVKLNLVPQWLIGLLQFDNIINNEIIYILSSNYFIIGVAILCITSVPDILLRKLKETHPLTYRVGRLVVSIALLLVSTSFMLMEVNL